MRIPEEPPPYLSVFKSFKNSSRLVEVIANVKPMKGTGEYLHWDKLRFKDPPSGITHEEWWAVLKFTRLDSLQQISLEDTEGKHFSFATPERVIENLHQIDLGLGGHISLPEPITNPNTRDRYLVSSLMEEAITSSQLEGAATTREVAREMIRTGRRPRDVSERMILNNFVTMRSINRLISKPLTPDLIFSIHKLVTDQTLDDPSAAGRFRNKDELRVVGDDYGNVYHTPPPADELPQRMEKMCAFANRSNKDPFIHPIVKAIILHFWLAYDHPFVDGNGRTARALFYWAVLDAGYWIFEFISISNILRKAPSKYTRSFLYTETDDNDLTYFILFQTEVIIRALSELHQYINRKTQEVRDIETKIRALDQLNHRQVELIRHALKHPGFRYSIASHRQSHNVAYQTARTDLIELEKHNLLEGFKSGRILKYSAPADLYERLLKLGG